MKENLIFKIILVYFLFMLGCNQQGLPYFHIQIIDLDTGEGIPMVELSSLNRNPFYSDSYGNIAYYEEGLMDGNIYFNIESPGYYIPYDETGRSGVTIPVKENGKYTIAMQRTLPAERLFRSTGSGIYNHTRLLDLQDPLKKSILNAGVLGQDSNLSSIYKNKIFWVWGDSFLPEKYNGNFAVAAATSPLPHHTAVSHKVGLNYDYFVDVKGMAKHMIEPKGPGYVWFDWLMNINDEHGEEKLLAKYARVNGYFGNYERGTALYNDSTQMFERYREEDKWLPDIHTTTHPILVESEGRPFYYLYNETGFSRVAPTIKDASNASAYEYFTYQGSSHPALYQWDKNGKPFHLKEQMTLVENGTIKPSEALLNAINIKTAEPIKLKRGTIRWNQYRQRWIMINGDKELYYLEADTPLGPWAYGVKVAQFENYYYNPVHHDFLDEEDGRLIYFEGTYTRFFGQGKLIPLYDYNQIMHRLDLSDPRVQLPLPVYEYTTNDRVREYAFRKDYITNSDEQATEIPFYAMENNSGFPNLVPVYKMQTPDGWKLTLIESDEPIFYGISPVLEIKKVFRDTWDARFQFASFDNYTSFSIDSDEASDKINSSKGAFQFSDLKLDHDSIEIRLRHENIVYSMKGKIVEGGIEGTCTNQSTKSVSKWSANTKSNYWWGQFSSQVEELYEYKNIKTAGYQYSSDPNLNDPTLMRQKNPVCQVWKNPYTLQFTELNTKPIEKVSNSN